MSTAYAVAHLRTPTLNDDIVEYLERIQHTMDPFGGRFAVHVPKLEVREGSWEGTLVILTFPSIDAARGWYDSRGLPGDPAPAHRSHRRRHAARRGCPRRLRRAPHRGGVPPEPGVGDLTDAPVASGGGRRQRPGRAHPAPARRRHRLRARRRRHGARRPLGARRHHPSVRRDDRLGGPRRARRRRGRRPRRRAGRRVRRSREHTPAPVVLAAAAMARDADADGFVSVGGSSVVDLTKGVALVVAEGDERIGPRPAAGRPPESERPRPHLAVPTILSGAEFTAAAGITDTSGRKRAYANPALAPRWVLLDPELTRATPPRLWAATGMKALADTIEVLCSRRATPLSDAVAVASLGMLEADLPHSTAHPDDLAAPAAARLRSPWPSCSSQASAPAWSLPSATSSAGRSACRTAKRRRSCSPTSCAGTPTSPQRRSLGPPARSGLGPTAVVDRIEQLIADLDLPSRLRDVGVDHESFPHVADLVLADRALATDLARSPAPTT